MTNRTETTPTAIEQRQFVEHLEQASRIVQSWPMWKQAVLGNIGAQGSCQAGNSQTSGGPLTGQSTTSGLVQP